MRSFLKGFLLAPIKDCFFWFVIFFLLALPRTIYHIQWQSWSFLVYVELCYLFASYLLVVICNFHRYFTRFLHWFFFCIILVWQLMNLFCVLYYGITIDHNIIQIVLNTNADEAGDFLSTFASMQNVLPLIGMAVAGCWLFALSLRGCKDLSKLGSYGLLALVVIAGVATFHNSAVIYDCFNPAIITYLTQEKIDLKKYQKSPILEEISIDHPQLIMVIIGESFEKRYSSLYGYKIKTNPRLSSFVEQGSLQVFGNVVAPAVGTTEAFKTILNTWHGDKETAWYESTTLMSAMRSAGYRSIWISNQAEKGLYDNLPSSYSTVCDEKLFSGYPVKKNCMDECLLPMISESVEQMDDSAKTILFVHLLGQHEGFASRFTPKYKIHESTEYETYPENQRSIRADYDNATLYNDYVVSEMMNLVSCKDALVVYFPDHGLDNFVSDPYYFGHAKTSVPESFDEGIQIPFVIYTSEQFKTLHPGTMLRIQSSVNYQFCTENLTYSIIDIAGYKVADNNEVEMYSLFSK